MSIANKIVVGLVGLTVMAVIFSAMLPIMGEVTSAEDTFTNEGYYRMTETDEQSVIVWDPSTDPFIITVNDVDISLNALKGYGYSNYSLAFADDIVLRYYYESASSQNLQIWIGDFQAGIASSSEYVATVTFNDDEVTFTTTQPDYVTKTFTHNGSYFVIDDKGEYIMKLRDKGAYMLKDDTFFYAGGISGIATSTFSGFYIEGTVDNYDVVPMRNTITVSNKTSTYSEVSGYVNLVSLDKIQFDTNYQPSDTPNERSQTYSYFLVPYEVTAEKAIHPDGPTTAILNMLPVIVGAGLLIGAIAFMIVTRK